MILTLQKKEKVERYIFPTQFLFLVKLLSDIFIHNYMILCIFIHYNHYERLDVFDVLFALELLALPAFALSLLVSVRLFAFLDFVADFALSLADSVLLLEQDLHAFAVLELVVELVVFGIVFTSYFLQ